MRLCFVADLHGRADLYHQLAQLLQGERPDVLLVGGDIGPTDLGPAGVASHRSWLLGPFAAFLAAAAPLCRVVLSRGNHDLTATADVLEKLQCEGLITLADGRWVSLAPSIWVAGFPFGPVSGWELKDWERTDTTIPPVGTLPAECLVSTPSGYQVLATEEHLRTQPGLGALLAELGYGPPGMTRMLLCHHPPYGSGLDRTAMAGRRGRNVGSRSIRSWIARSGLELALHGHIHEAPYLTGSWGQLLGETLCVNPGQWGATIHATLFETEDVQGTLTHTIFGRWSAGPAPRQDLATLRAAIRGQWQSAGLVSGP